MWIAENGYNRYKNFNEYVCDLIDRDYEIK